MVWTNSVIKGNFELMMGTQCMSTDLALNHNIFNLSMSDNLVLSDNLAIICLAGDNSKATILNEFAMHSKKMTV